MGINIKGLTTVVNTAAPGSKLQLLYGEVVWDPASVNDKDNTGTSIVTTDITVNGAAIGDPCLVGIDVDLIDMTLTANVTSADIVSVVLFNGTADDANVGAATTLAKVVVFHFINS